MNCSCLPVDCASNFSFVEDFFHQISSDFSALVDRIVSYVLSKSFFFGYDPLTPDLANDRRNALLTRGDAVSLPCQNDQGVDIDAIYISSTAPNRTGNVMVFAETTSYQDRLHNGLPVKYKHFLDRGADIVFWNPTDTKGRQYSKDLESVIQSLRTRDLYQKIMIKAHCASVEPAIGAAARFQGVSLLLDRGYDDVWELSRSFTILASLPFVHRVIQEQFSSDAMESLAAIQERIVFIAPEDPAADQIVFWQGRNFTYEMHQKRLLAHHDNDAFITLGAESDHWSPWNAEEYHRIDEELEQIGIIARGYLPPSHEEYPDRQARSFFAKSCLPFLIKTWC